MESIITYKKLVSVVIVVIVGVLLSVDDNSSDVKLVDKQARLPSSELNTFRFVSQLANLKYWSPSLISCEETDNSPIGMGKHYSQLYQFPIYGQVSINCMIMSFESPKFISYLCNDWLSTRVEMSVEASSVVPSHPSLITLKVFSRRRSYFFKYLISPVLIIYYEAWARQALFTLKYSFDQVTY